jgi:hypothetical protein
MYSCIDHKSAERILFVTMPVSRKAKSIEPAVCFIATAGTIVASFVVKEIQRLLSICSYATLPTTSAKMSTLEALLFDAYHGKTGCIDSASLVSQLLAGRGPFGDLFERSTSLTGETVLTLNPLLMPGRTEFPRVGPVTNPASINSELVSGTTLPKKGKSVKKISGRGIMAQADAVSRIFKLAVSEGKKFLDKDGKLPSGTTVKDYLEFVCKRLYHLLKGQQGMTDPDCDPTDETEPDSKYQAEMPEGWTFAGFMAFALFGPFGKEDDQLDCLKHGTLVKQRNILYSMSACNSNYYIALQSQKTSCTRKAAKLVVLQMLLLGMGRQFLTARENLLRCRMAAGQRHPIRT